MATGSRFGLRPFTIEESLAGKCILGGATDCVNFPAEDQRIGLDGNHQVTENIAQFYPSTNEVRNVLTMEEIANLAAEGGKPAETLMNVVALIAKRFRTEVCSAYLLEPDRANLVLAATVGLRKECIGSLRMAVHEGLTGLVAELVRPVSVEPGEDPSSL